MEVMVSINRKMGDMVDKCSHEAYKYIKIEPHDSKMLHHQVK